MKKLLAMSFILFALVLGSAQLLSPAYAKGGCGCPKGLICCRGCDGHPAFCARSFAFCPECPAP